MYETNNDNCKVNTFDQKSKLVKCRGNCDVMIDHDGYCKDCLNEDWTMTEFENENQLMKKRCGMFNSNGEQCNLFYDHECKCHHYGLDSILFRFLPVSTCDIDNDIHDGSCSICLVREVRGR